VLTLESFKASKGGLKALKGRCFIFVLLLFDSVVVFLMFVNFIACSLISDDFSCHCFCVLNFCVLSHFGFVDSHLILFDC